MKVRTPNTLAVRATLCYTVSASAWILLSDPLLSTIADARTITWVSMAKGMAFVLATAVLLYMVLDRQSRRLATEPPATVSDAVATARQPQWIYYGIAVALTLAALLSRSGATIYFGEQAYRILFVFPIVGSALLGGLGPGLVATVIAALGLDIATATPAGSLFDEPADLFNWALLIGAGALVSVMSEALHRSRGQAEARGRALAEGEARLRRALAASAMGVWEWDVRTNEVFASHECRDILGIERQGATLASLTDRVDSADAERLVALAEQAIVQRTTYSAEFRVAFPDGQMRWLASVGRAQYDPDGHPLRMVGTVQDVTERHAREEELARLSRAYATLGQINKTVSTASSRRELFEDACRIAAKTAGYRLAWIGWLNAATQEVTPEARAGEAQAYVDQIHVRAGSQPGREGAVRTCIREDRTVVYNSAFSASSATSWRRLAAANGLRSVAAIPLHFAGEVCGALAVYAADPNVFQESELALLNEAAESISFALARLDGDVRRKQAEAGLRQREALLDRTSRMAKVGGWWFDVKTRRGAWSDEVACIHDLKPTPTTTVEQSLTFFHGPARAVIEQALREAIDEATPYDLELELVTAKGVRKWVRTRGEPVMKDGKVIRVEGVMQDITKRKRAEVSLAAERAHLRTLLDTIPDLVWLKDPNGVFLTCNPLFERLYGAKESEIVGETDYDFVDAELANSFREHDRRAIAAGEPSVNEEWVTFADDNHRALLQTIKTPMHDADGRLVGVLGIARDRTAMREAEDALKASEERFRLMVEGLKAEYFFYQHDTGGVVTYVSPGITEMLGYTPEEAQAHFSTFLTDSPTNAEVATRVAAAVAGATQPAFEVEVRHKDGSVRCFEILEVPTVGAHGNVVDVYGIAHDISERKRAEEKLRQLSLAVEQSPVSILITDPKGGIEYANRTFTETSGYPLTEALGQNPRILQSGKTPPETYADLWTTIKAGGIWRGELANRRKDGRDYVELATISPVREPDGSITHFLAVQEDITERKRIETELANHRHHLEELVESRTAALKAAEEHARLILASSAAGLFGLDAKGRATFINPAACTMLGYTCEQVLGQSLHALIHHRRADGTTHPESECPMRHSLQGGEVVQVEDDVFWRADGEPVSIQYAAHPMYREGQIVGAVVSFFDVTAQREAASARAQALAEAERLARLRSEFLANMSHEIRTPLNAVLGLAQVGQRKSAGSAARDHFSRILDAGQLLLAIVNDVLDFSKIEAGKLELEQVPCRLGDVIDQAVDLIAARAKTKGLELLVEEAVDLPETCDGDPVRLTQVLLNLLSNAVKFTEHGAVSLFAGREGECLIFRVTDTGIGMSPQHVKRLFTPFEQADGATTRRFGGTGLGLAISKRLVNLMGGEIDVTSGLGKGASFEVRLPLTQTTPLPPLTFKRVALAGLRAAETCSLMQRLSACGIDVVTCTPQAAFSSRAELVVVASEALDQRLVLEAARQALANDQKVALVCDAGEASSIPPKLPEGGRVVERPLRLRHLVAAVRGAEGSAPASAVVGPRLVGVRVLAAEDNEVNRLVLAEMLEGEGAQVVFAENGRVAVEVVGRSAPPAFDVVLMDIQMPEMGGLEATRHILTSDPRLPIIGLTAHAMPQERQRCLDAGMVEHVAKPVDLDELVAAVERHARGVESAARTSGEPPAPPSQAAPVVPVVDWSGLEARFHGKSKFIDKLAATVLKTHSEAPNELRAAAARNDLEALVFRAHSLKGMAGNMMAAEARAIAREAEAAAKAGQEDAVASAERLATAIEVLLADVAKRVAVSESIANQEAVNG